jgi:hypothetical protein
MAAAAKYRGSLLLQRFSPTQTNHTPTVAKQKVYKVSTPALYFIPPCSFISCSFVHRARRAPPLH